MENRLINTFVFFGSIFLMLAFSSCKSYQHIPYFQDYSDSALPLNIKTVTFKSPVIQPDDLLSISIQTLDPESAELFYKSNTPISSVGASTGSPIGSQVTAGHLVDKLGNVELPIIGKVHLQGLTTAEAIDTIRNRVAVYYKSPAVDVHFSNFKITVLGEVNKPAAYVLPNERITIFDALGAAGDMTVYGKRENVLLVRDTLNEKKLVRLNLNSKDIVKSPYFYLHQNDMLYIEPNKAKIASLDAVRTRNITIGLSVISLLIIAIRYIKL